MIPAPTVDLSWLGLLSQNGQVNLRFAEDMLYGLEFDTAVRSASRFGQTLDEMLDAEHVSIRWAKCVPPEPAVSTAPEAAKDDDFQPPVQFSLAASAVKSTVQKSLPEIRKSDDQDNVSKAEEEVKMTVRTLLSTIIGNGSATETEANLKMLPAMKTDDASGKSSVLFLYEVEGAGENAKNPRRSPTPLRKNHLEHVILACLKVRADLCNEPSGSASSVAPPRPSDVLLVCFN